MVAKFSPLTYEDHHNVHADGKFTRERHWMYRCDPGYQAAWEPTGRYDDEMLQPHSLKVSHREWGGYDNESPSDGNVWSVELRVTREAGGHPVLVSPTFLDVIMYVIDDWTPDGWPEIDVRDVLDVELLHYR